MNESGCIFCKIVRGEIKSCIVHENADVLAFLDIGPLAEGHTLVIPRRHYQDIRDISVADLTAVMGVIPQLARTLLKVTGASGMNLLQNTGASSGQAVFHVHFHLIPRREGDQLGYRWNAGSYAAGRMEALQAQIVQAMN